MGLKTVQHSNFWAFPIFSALILQHAKDLLRHNDLCRDIVKLCCDKVALGYVATE